MSVLLLFLALSQQSHGGRSMGTFRKRPDFENPRLCWRFLTFSLRTAAVMSVKRITLEGGLLSGDIFKCTVSTTIIKVK